MKKVRCKMKKCKECGREEWGYLSVLNEDGYCQLCATVHNEEKIKKLQEQLKEANALLKGLYDALPCQFDNLGYCQEHGSTDGNYICVQGELKEYLERYCKR